MPQPLSRGLPKDFLRARLLLLREGKAHGYELGRSRCGLAFRAHPDSAPAGGTRPVG